MIVAELIEALRAYPHDMRVTVYNRDTQWLLPIKVVQLPATTASDKHSAGDRAVDFVAITCDHGDPIEGWGPYP